MVRPEGKVRWPGSRDWSPREPLASHGNVNCERWKNRIPNKVSNRFEADAVKLRKEPAGTKETNY